MIDANTIAANGITISSAGDPVVALCRRLIADGWDGSLPLRVWRGTGPARFVYRIDQPDNHVRFQKRKKNR
jgi:hypothetical protein